MPYIPMYGKTYRGRPLRVGRGPSFELSECILESRPKAPKLIEVTAPPLWALRAVSENSGKRTPPWKRTEYNYASSWQHPGSVYTGESEYDFNDMADTSGVGTARYTKKQLKRKLKERQKAAKNVIPKGNLREEDYRFWKGYAMEGDPQSNCRWCFHTAYTPAARRDHHRTNHCNAKLMIVYKLGKGLERPKCFACGKVTHQDRWGVPLCQDPACLSRWKFSPMEFFDVFAEMRRHALVSGYLDGFKDEMKNVKSAIERNAVKRP